MRAYQATDGRSEIGSSDRQIQTEITTAGRREGSSIRRPSPCKLTESPKEELLTTNSGDKKSWDAALTSLSDVTAETSLYAPSRPIGP